MAAPKAKRRKATSAVRRCSRSQPLTKGYRMHPVSVWVCPDCLQAIANGDFSSLDYHYNHDEANKRKEEIVEGMDRLAEQGTLTVGDDFIEFATIKCECCNTQAHGSRYEAVILVA